MINQLIQLLLMALASIIVMILHELPKAMIYANTYNKVNKSYKKNVFALYQYIDPIGLIFCITQMAGFSKPYVYRLNDKEMNKTLGTVGFNTLLMIFAISMLFVNVIGVQSTDLTNESIGVIDNYIFSFVLYIAAISMGMFLVNLFPIATFDMGLLVASRSTDKYYSLIKNDYLIKIFLMLFMVTKIFPNITLVIIEFFIFI